MWKSPRGIPNIFKTLKQYSECNMLSTLDKRLNLNLEDAVFLILIMYIDCLFLTLKKSLEMQTLKIGHICNEHATYCKR